jgi:hypothetical protein
MIRFFFLDGRAVVDDGEGDCSLGGRFATVGSV